MPAPTPITGQTDILVSPEGGTTPTSRFGSEFEPYVAGIPGGGFIAIWDDFLPQSSPPAGYPYALDPDGGVTVMWRIFDAAGVPLDVARPVTSNLTGNNSAAGVTALGNGNVAIAWDMSASGTPGSSRVGVTILNPATGAVVGTEQVVATGTGQPDADVMFADILALSGGRAGVLFVDRAGTDQLRLTIIEADGTQGATTTLLTATSAFLPALGTSEVSAVLSGPNADVIAVPVRINSGPGLNNVEIRFFNTDGSAAAIPTINLGNTGGFSPTVVALPGGGLATALWVSAPAGSTSFQVRRWDATGAQVGSATTVTFASTAFSNTPELLALPDGGLMVAISGVLPGFTDANIYGQRIAADGSLDGGVVELDGSPLGRFETRPQLALTSDSEMVVVWEDQRSPSDYQIRAARLDLGLGVPEPIVDDGTPGNDTLDGDLLADSLSGADGNDLLNGLAGNDLLRGEAGADTLDGGAGEDSLVGGTGDDLYLVDTQSDLVFENPGEGHDTVIASTGFYLYANIEDLILATGAGAIFGVGNELANRITGNESPNTLISWDGNDTLLGLGGNDILYAVAGDDEIDGGAGIDFLAGGEGNDTLRGGLDPDQIFGEAGDDSIVGGPDFVFDLMVGGEGADTIDGRSGNGDFDYLYGGDGNDLFMVDTPDDLVFEFAGGGNDTVQADIVGAGYYLYAEIEDLVLLGATPFGVGNELANRLTGSDAANWLLGGAGADTLNGKGGGDVLFGEGGADSFVFERGTGGDVIGDFVSGEDRLVLSGLGFADAAAVLAAFTVVGGSSAIDLGLGDFVVLNGVTSLAASDIVLV